MRIVKILLSEEILSQILFNIYNFAFDFLFL